MPYDRYRQGERDPRDNRPDQYGDYSSARDYEAAGLYDRGGRYGGDRSRSDGYGRPGGGQGDRGYPGGSYDSRPSGYYGGGERGRGTAEPYYGSYASDGHRFDDYRGDREAGQREFGRGDQGRGGGYGRPPQGYNYQERGFLDRAGDEVRSWFGDEEAERRREHDARYDQRGGGRHDEDYHNWRSGQVAALDRDYDEYRREHRSKFESEFANWRTERQGQRSSLGSVAEHMEVVGSDGSHVGTVDKVRGDRIILTKSDQDAGGRHHSIPSRWIDQVSDKVTLRKTADEAQREWRDEERNQAQFGDDRGDRTDRSPGGQYGGQSGGGILGRSFSGTY